MSTLIRSARSLVAPLGITAALASGARAEPARQDPALASAPPGPVATVLSRDGTRVAYERSGAGPVLVLVGSALSDRSDAARLAALLAPHFTVINYDRRGRGDSGDTRPYAVEREIEDLEALLVQEGGQGALFGSSSGAVLALEAASRLTSRVEAVVLFEPPFIVDDTRPPLATDFLARIEALLAAERRGDAVALFMTEAVGVPAPMVDGMRHAPMWPSMERRAHTLPYDCTIMAGLQAGRPLPAERWKAVRARTLAIDGEQSDPFLRSAVAALVAVVPGAERHTLAGQDHSAAYMAPETLVPVLVDFLRAGAEKVANGRK